LGFTEIYVVQVDAKSIIKAFKSQEGKIFGRVETKLPANAEASVEAITDALKSLESEKENDLAVIFLAGHGIMSKDEVFYFLTPSGDLEKPEKGGISWNLLGDALNKVKGRVLVLLDACHSGNISTQVIVPNDELAQKLRSEGKSGIMVFSASKGRQSALEDVDGGYGVFAHAITQSLGPESKQADTNGNGFVEFMELVDYVRKKVDKETEGDQTPWLSRKELFGDFAIASVLGTSENSAANKGATIINQPAVKNAPAPDNNHSNNTTRIENELFAKAKKDFDSGDFEASRTGFEDFIKRFPDSTLACSAQFWIGEVFYKQKRYENAILEYQKGIETYPDGNKMQALLLKQGFSYFSIGENAKGKTVLIELINKFPSTEEADIAKRKIEGSS